MLDQQEIQVLPSHSALPWEKDQLPVSFGVYEQFSPQGPRMAHVNSDACFVVQIHATWNLDWYWPLIYFSLFSFLLFRKKKIAAEIV